MSHASFKLKLIDNIDENVIEWQFKGEEETGVTQPQSIGTIVTEMLNQDRVRQIVMHSKDGSATMVATREPDDA